MPLQIKRESGLDRPVVICDHCGLEITEAKDGNYEWEVGEEGEILNGTIYFTHKRCCHAFEQTNRGCARWYAIGLECLPVYLANNLQMDWDRAKRTAWFMSTL
jgi:hypothetical protein